MKEQTDDHKISAACDICRRLKVRCDRESLDTSQKCARCARLDKECLTTLPVEKKRRRRTGARVGDLERRIEHLIAAVNRKTGSESKDSPFNSNAQTPAFANAALPGNGDGVHPRSSLDHRSSPTDQTSGQTATPTDVVGQGLLSMSKAVAFFDVFRNEMIPHYPLIAFRPSTTAQEIREARPVLFLVIMAAAAATTDPDLARVLNKEILRIFAEKVVVAGERSVELVQSLLLFSAWYFAPDEYAEMRFTWFAQLAATMAQDLALDQDWRNEPTTVPDSSTPRSGDPLTGQNSPDTMSQEAWTRTEKCRTLLACYLISSV